MWTRTTLAFIVLFLLLFATTYSLWRWQQIRGDAAEFDRLRLERTRDNLSAKLKRLPVCLWARDFLRAPIKNARYFGEPADEGDYGPVLHAIQIAKKCVPLEVAASSGMARQEEAQRWSKLVDMYARQLEDEIMRSTR